MTAVLTLLSSGQICFSSRSRVEIRDCGEARERKICSGFSEGPWQKGLVGVYRAVHKPRCVSAAGLFGLSGSDVAAVWPRGLPLASGYSFLSYNLYIVRLKYYLDSLKKQLSVTWYQILASFFDSWEDPNGQEVSLLILTNHLDFRPRRRTAGEIKVTGDEPVLIPDLSNTWQAGMSRPSASGTHAQGVDAGLVSLRRSVAGGSKLIDASFFGLNSLKIARTPLRFGRAPLFDT